MNDQKITEEVIRYIDDKTYNYAILIDGEWGCGKTYYVKQYLMPEIDKIERDKDMPRKLKYISLYGCKSVDNIQENIVYGFIDEMRESVLPKTEEKSAYFTDSIISSGRKIVNSFAKQFLQNTNPADLALGWVRFENYIFIFDDLERCDCPLNEVFGFINGLVEHENSKVILVANENEIGITLEKEKEELQYLVASNPNIIWPIKKEIYGSSEQKLDIEKLNRRRILLFSDKKKDENYGKIREKLIGVTLVYQPDIKFVLQQIISNSNIEKKLSNILLNNLNAFCVQMDKYSHHNLRTFQFFVSKMNYIFSKIKNLEEEYVDQAITYVADCCFTSCVRFKGNVKPPIDTWEKFHYECESQIEAIKVYVEHGEFLEEKFEHEIMQIIAELKCKILPDDPLKLLRDNYWLHEQQWVEDKIAECMQKLQSDQYGLALYNKIVILFCELVNIGFSEKILTSMKECMLNNIRSMKNEWHISAELYFVDDIKTQERVLNIIKELNETLSETSMQYRTQTITEILKSSEWVNGLDDYIKTPSYQSMLDGTIFNKADPQLWISVINKADSMQITMFSQLFSSMYPHNFMREEARDDLKIIAKIKDGIDLNANEDLIIRMNLKLLQNQMIELLKRYSEN